MRSDYTANGRHKDDPTNPESYWNDWSIDRDGNKLEESKSKKANVKKDIKKINEDFKNINLKLNIALLTTNTEEDKMKVLLSTCQDLIKIVVEQNDLIEKLR